MQTELFENEKLYVAGKPLVTIFHNEQNMFTIVKLKIQSTNLTYDEKELIVTGYFPRLYAEDTYRFVGDLKQHPKYGLQFQAQSFQKEVPNTEQGVVHYLSSDLFPGIGRKTAEFIVKKLGQDAIKKMVEDPNVLDDMKQIPYEKKKTILSTLQSNLGMERVIIQLNDWGFGPQLAMRIFQTYKEETIEILSKNPYQLIEDVEGVGFHRADDIGQQIGMTGAHPSRIKAAILHLLNQSALQDGHVFVESEYLVPAAKKLLESSQSEEISYDSISTAIIELAEEGKIMGEQTKCYLPSLYYSEVGIATKLQLLLDQEVSSQFPLAEVKKAIGHAEESLEVTYAPNQVAAIEKAIQSPVLVLTGGPGTGKTTVVRGIVEVFAKLHGFSLNSADYSGKDEAFPILLAAPTGRAAKRMNESTGLPAMTIHRLLGFTGQEKEEESDREIEAKLIIIDEMSMVDTWLAHQLLKAIPEETQVIFVGDQDQLPPVGPGQVLKDILASEKIPTIELKTIFRQAEGSSIIQLAHHMKNGEMDHTLRNKTNDRSFISASTTQIPVVVEQVIKNALSKGHSIRDIQVLAPMYKGPAGIDALNKMIQEMVNPNPDSKRKEIVFGDITFRIGDKVLQLVNQPESQVFNGDMGEIVSIFRANENVEKQDLVIVSFDGNEVTYQRSDLNQLTLAYCCSIHKSQGSEFPIVIMPIVRSYMKMLRRNLLYTGITRAKDFLILCGEADVFQYGIERGDDLSRATTLASRLIDDELPKIPTEDESNEMELTTVTIQSIDPLVGMNDVKPEDFLV